MKGADGWHAIFISKQRERERKIENRRSRRKVFSSQYRNRKNPGAALLKKYPYESPDTCRKLFTVSLCHINKSVTRIFVFRSFSERESNRSRLTIPSHRSTQKLAWDSRLGPITTAELSKETKKRTRASDDCENTTTARLSVTIVDSVEREHRGAAPLSRTRAAESRDERSGAITGG